MKKKKKKTDIAVQSEKNLQLKVPTIYVGK
jgi:hypothetical protein